LLYRNNTKIDDLLFYKKGCLMEVRIDEELCTGCGLCEETCPDIFKMDEDKDIAVIIKTDYDEYDEECIQEAVESCPSEAISTE
jgi:ferredoxin